MDNPTPAPEADPIAEAIARQVATATNVAETAMRNKAVSLLEECLDEQINRNALEEDTAYLIFSQFLSGIGSYADNPYQTKYRVTVTIEGDFAFRVTVEADCEEDAIAEVQDNLSIDYQVRKGTISYNGEFDVDNDHDYEVDDEDIEIEHFDINFEAELVDKAWASPPQPRRLGGQPPSHLTKG